MSRSFFRRLAPGLLAAFLTFLVVADAGAGCLAAWLCPPPAAADCASGHEADRRWEPSSGSCSFARSDGSLAQRLERWELAFAPTSSATPAGGARPASGGHLRRPLQAHALPLFALHPPLLI